EVALRTMIPGVGAGAWPLAAELGAAIDALSKSGLGRLFGQRAGREMLQRLRLPDDTASREALRRLEAHLRATDAFAASQEGKALFGERWSGVATPFDTIAEAIRRHWDLSAMLSPL